MQDEYYVLLHPKETNILKPSLHIDKKICEVYFHVQSSISGEVYFVAVQVRMECPLSLVL